MIDPLLQKLVNIPSVSGGEREFQKLVESELKSVSGSSFEDVLDNHIAKIGSGSEKVMISAHADEVGFIITYIDDDGFMYVQPVGGVDADVAVGQVVSVQTKAGPLMGIIGKAEKWPTASSADNDNDDVVPFRKLWLDIGANNKTRELVSIGDLVVYHASIYEMPDERFLARGADNKLGVYAVIKTAERFAGEVNPKITLYAATTAQEEVGSRGVPPVVARVQPKSSIIIDTTPATDTPDANKEEMGRMQLGSGPTISRGGNTNPELHAQFVALAKREQIPYQVEAEPGPTATDADSFQTLGEGSSAIVIGIPVRYTHFPAEVFSQHDVENCIKLVSAFVNQL